MVIDSKALKRWWSHKTGGAGVWGPPADDCPLCVLAEPEANFCCVRRPPYRGLFVTEAGGPLQSRVMEQVSTRVRCEPQGVRLPGVPDKVISLATK